MLPDNQYTNFIENKLNKLNLQEIIKFLNTIQILKF